MSELSTREQELVALGAAIASNCVPCVEYHVPEARKAGVSDLQMREAVRIADKVRRVPARKVVQTALARLEETPKGPAEAGEGTSRPNSSRAAAALRQRLVVMDVPSSCETMQVQHFHRLWRGNGIGAAIENPLHFGSGKVKMAA